MEPNTIDSWIHPPYSGLYDGTWVWGRGALDDKTGLVGIMVTLEKLIERGFKPKRGILVGFGIDEEASGLEVGCFISNLVYLVDHLTQGAGRIAKYIEETYGKNSVSILVDEGGE